MSRDRMANDGVQPGGGFVKEHDLRIPHQGSSKGGPPDHSTADLCWIFILSPAQTHLIQNGKTFFLIS